MQSTSAESSKWFHDEIRCMLHAFGDVSQPLDETVTLISKIVHSILCDVLAYTSGSARMRKCLHISIEDIIYLLRKDRSKLVRYLQYVRLKEMKMKIIDNVEEGNVLEAEGKENPDVSSKIIKICKDFLSCVGFLNSWTELCNEGARDKVRLQRLERAEVQTRNMNNKEYSYYTKCRKITFSKEMTKFQDWLADVLLKVELKPNALGWEALAYVAQELVAETIDITLLVKEEQKGIVDLNEQTSVCRYTESKSKDSSFEEEPFLSCHVKEAFRRHKYFQTLSFHHSY